MNQSSKAPYRLGLPAWAFPGWRGVYFDDRPSALASYARVFNAVEGNTTFYRIPDASSVARWREAVDGTDFRFSFKLPSTVTHERRASMEDLERFLTVIHGLKGHLGPLLVQFPAWAGPEHLARCEAVLQRVCEDVDAVLEVRHPIYFAEPERLDDVLMRHGVGRVMLDSRPLYQGDLSHPAVLKAVHEKPDVPVIKRLYNDSAFVRLILHPDDRFNDPWIDEWVEQFARWLSEGVRSTMMVHCPDNGFCPPMARTFHRRLMARLAEEGGRPRLSALPDWPVPQQSSLF